ncbi:PrpF domain containing protein [Pyrenophora tritici-repentis]|nr:PrpF multi-domain protein [Pyrenophora tritici-repentis]KAF7449376.1 PrpF multi-domain protein [Pyrenophora tritici-repentis]KAG9383622.1 PrpF multi-domain protein [Pyrenophora tritici-repentis]KAI0576632.1 PrpF multi-domain protein [Pyrenophora tritici-repentis]KAI0585848.1 PrpF multi-domain protein [Pyrenophora tritici-repentis]
MGSGDPYGRQLDGLGAGISSLSKICLVEPYGKRVPLLGKGARYRTGSRGLDAIKETMQVAEVLDQKEAERNEDEEKLDIDYTFVGLGIENDEVDVAGNCGNMSSAIGPYAYNAGLLPASVYAKADGEVTVKIRNTNTGKLIDSTFNVVGGEAVVTGDYTIDGVTGKGSQIKLDFKNPYGSKTGKVLPTGRRIDNIAGYRVTCIDGANPAVFIRADDVGVDGTILPNDFNKLFDKLALLEDIRKAAAVAMGIAETEDLVPRTIPKIGLVSQSSSHPVLSGKTLNSSQMDIVVRFLSDTQPHRAIPLTAALTTAVAARIPGTIVEQMLAPEPLVPSAITIGHASGQLQVDATMHEKNKLIPVSGTVFRTAKRLFEGDIFYTNVMESTSAATSTSVDNVNYSSNGRHSLGMAFVLEHRGKDSSHLFEGDSQPETKTAAPSLEPEPEPEHQQTLEQVEKAEQEPKEIKLQYRPLPDPHRKRHLTPESSALPDFSTIPRTSLNVALKKLLTDVTELLTDRAEAVAQLPTHATEHLADIVNQAGRKVMVNYYSQKRAFENEKKEKEKKLKSLEEMVRMVKSKQRKTTLKAKDKKKQMEDNAKKAKAGKGNKGKQGRR